MKKIIAIIIITAGVRAALAETSTNSVVPAPKPHWESSISAGLTLTKGNSDTLLVTTMLLTAKKTPDNEYSLGIDGTYGENSSVKNNESLHAFGQWNHLFSERLYSYVRVEGLHDGIAGITYRATISPGAGYYFIKNQQTYLAGEVGPGAVFERLGNTDSSYGTLRLAERFEHKFAERGARVWQTVEFLPQLDRPDNYLINAEIGVESALSKNLSLKVYLDDTFASRPAAGRKDNDVKLVSGVTYKF